MQEIMNVLVAWLSVTTGLPAAETLPEVKQLPPHHIATVHFGYELDKATDDIVAVYIPSSQTVVLRDDWDSRKPADVSVLVHELVHHMQHAAGKEFMCREAAEAGAFEAQQRWLAQFGMNLESAFGIDAFSLKLKTSCLPY